MPNTYTPTVDLTIFPKTHLIHDYDGRAYQREAKGRAFLRSTSIDNVNAYPPSLGALSFSTLLPLPADLGPDVATPPTLLVDLREDDGVLTTYDLNPL